MVGASAQVTHCAGCSIAFSLLLPPHLCRACGDSFCHGCSSGKRAVPERGFSEQVRVCDLCLHVQDRRAKLLGISPGAGGTNKSGLSDVCLDGESEAASLRRREAHFDAMNTLKRIYKAKIRPLEQLYRFADFYGTELTDGDFDAKPLVLLVGQYSVGKTSFIQHLLGGREFVGARIGPEPTTDRFMAVMSARTGQRERVVPGNAAAVDVDRPFAALSRFGVAFLSRFEIAETHAPLLKSITLVDTPGVLSGEKQRVSRGYEFEEVVEWFAERADRILLLFDAHKLDISDELRRVVERLRPHDDKLRIILNKADGVDAQQLMRVYGALMYSLGRVLHTPEVSRVYIGSFWDHPLNPAGSANHALFEAERADLIADLEGLPRESALRKINELVKRTRLAKTHAIIVSQLRATLPMWNQKKAQAKYNSAARLREEFDRIALARGLVPGDLPPIDKFRSGLAARALGDFPQLSRRLVDVVDGALGRDIPKLMLALGAAADEAEEFNIDSKSSGSSGEIPAQVVEPSEAARPVKKNTNPFAEVANDGVGTNEVEWAVPPGSQRKWSAVFSSRLEQMGDSVPRTAGGAPALAGLHVRELMLESGLDSDLLRRIWDLSDVDGDGLLDGDEFIIAMSLIKRARDDGSDVVPTELPRAWVPPQKRALLAD